MAHVEDTKKPKLRPNFSNWELVSMISMVSDNKILLLDKLDSTQQEGRQWATGNDHICANS